MKNTQVGQPSPNPDYPQDIEVIDTVNLFDKDKAISNSSYTGEIGQNIVITTNVTAFRVTKIVANSNSITIDANKTSGTFRVKLTDSDDIIRYNQAFTRLPQTIDTTTYKNIYIYFDKTTITIDNDIQITPGTISKPYLPYGYIGLEQSGKNLIPCGYQVGYSVNFHSNVKLEILEKNRVKLSGTTSTSSISFNYMNDTQNNKINWYKGKTYTLSFKIISGSFSGNLVIHTSYKNDKDNVSVWNNLHIDCARENSKSVTIEKEGYSPRLIIYAHSNTVLNDLIIEIQLEEGTEATSYEPYHLPKLYPINLDGNSLAKVGNIYDVLNIYRNGKVEIKKNTGVLEFNNLALSFSNPNKFQYNILVPITFKFPNALCNYFENLSKQFDTDSLFIQYVTENNIENCFNLHPSKRAIRFYSKMISSLDEFKNLMNNKDVKLYYNKEFPTTIELPSIEQIKTWEGTNLFRLISNIDTDFEIEYIIDKNAVSSQIQQAMLDAEIEL